MKLNADTILRVTVAERTAALPPSDFGPPELFCLVPFRHLAEVLAFRHVDAERRIKAEIEGGASVAFVYKQSSLGKGLRYSIEIGDK